MFVEYRILADQLFEWPVKRDFIVFARSLESIDKIFINCYFSINTKTQTFR